LKEAIIRAKPDVVIHQLTNLPHRIDPRHIKQALAQTNRLRSEGTQILMDAAKAAGVRRFVAQSISSYYAPTSTSPAIEDEPLFTKAPAAFADIVYAIDSLEQTVLNTPGIEGVVLRYGYFYGPGTAYAADGSLAEGIITNIGQDLQDDHPIGIQYAGFQLDPVNNAGVQIDADFWTDGEGLATTTINNVPMWWIDTETGPGQAGNGTREKTDIQLYTRLNGAENQPFVECASCHDPHIDRETFLRIDNTGSLVCRTCHDKSKKPAS